MSNEGINQQIVEMAGVTSPIAQHEKVSSMGAQSEADEAQDLGAETGAMAERGGDVAGTGYAEQRDG